MTESSPAPAARPSMAMRGIRSIAYRVIAPMLDAREERANANLAPLESTIASLESRIASLESKIASLDSQNQELRDTVTPLAEDSEMLRSDVVAVTRQISRLVDDAR